MAGAAVLPEGTVLRGLDGVLVSDDANDVWLFELVDDINEPTGLIPSGARLQVLPSGTLAQMISDANDRLAPEYRITAQVTRYQDKNFLLALYYLPLSRFKDAAEPNQPQATDTQPQGRPDGGPTIPEEALAILQSRRPVRGPQRTEPAGPPSQPTQMLVGRTGLIERHEDRWQFVPDGAGWNVSSIRYELLPSSMLEQVLAMVATSINPIHFNVSGPITEYEGVEYLILQRAVRAYDYGNFN